MDIEILKKELEDNNIENAKVMIEKIGESRCKEALPLLIKYLGTTSNHVLRNTIALALSDIGDPIAIEPLISVLQDEKVFGKRGTILYALEIFNCSPYIELLVDILINGNFEESRQSLSLIESFKQTISVERIRKCTERIVTTIERLEDRINLLTESLDVLEEI